MRLQEAIGKLTRFSTPAVPELRYIETAVQKVHERWPDVSVPVSPRERETLAAQLRDRVARDDWADARISFVIAAAQAVFDAERRDRADLNDARSFLYAEVRASRSETFLSGILTAHLENFEAGAAHTRALALALDTARDRMSISAQRLMHQVSELLDAADGPRRLAVRMAQMTDPFLELTRAGLRNPHGPGFMERAHEALSTIIQPELTSRGRIDWFLDWLRPSGRNARTSGAEQAIEALTHPWLNNAPPDQLRSYLVEALIELYGDPRIRSGGVWAGVAPANMRIIHRWLTREDMRFFTGVVDAAQKDAMWPPRRDFWLKLYDEGMIDAAWVAFSARAMEYAREHLMRQDARNAGSRFGFQQARQNTSLLIMRIGNKIVVDGCHSYKTHVFNETDPMAPRLFQEGYDCDEVMRRAPVSKAHHSIPVWSRWVRDTVNSDVPYSRVNLPYQKVFRPRAAPFVPRGRAGVWGTTQQRSAHVYEGPSSHPPQSRTVEAAGARLITGNPGSSRIPMTRQDVPSGPGNRSEHGDPGKSLRETRFSSLTDRLIAYGSDGASAVLALFDGLDDGRPRPLLSPKAREGLEWVRGQREDPPVQLRNALEHMLISLKNGGRDLDDLFATRLSADSVGSAQGFAPTSASAKTAPRPRTQLAKKQPELPPLPDTGTDRLELLHRHVDALEAFAREWNSATWEQNFGVAVTKLRGRRTDLRPAEIHELQKLYELMRKLRKGERR